MAKGETIASGEDWKMWIDGEFVGSDSGEELDVLDPATGEPFATVPAGSVDDVDRAVGAAREAFESFKWTDPAERSEVLLEIADRIDEHREELIELETLENGKTLPQSASDVENAVRLCRFFAGAADKFFGDAFPSSITEHNTKVFEPRGVVGIITPWNWPPMHTADFLAPAIAGGNTVVWKPAPETPLSTLRIAEITADLLPDGVFNVVTGGVEPGVALTGHPGIDKLFFTGNDDTGAQVMEAAAENITPVAMELGGKNASIVFPDADLDRAVPGTVSCTFYNNGQSCINTELVLVHEAIADEVTDRLAESVSNLVVGDGREDGTQISPLVNEKQVVKFEAAIERAKDEGAEVLARADLPDDSDLEDGFFVAPTLFGNVTPEMTIAREEVFGPVTAVIPFADEDEALEIANGVQYGLGCNIWTRDINRAHRVSSRIDAGIVAINDPNGAKVGLPFGGFKRSGTGYKKDFSETMREFTRAKSIHIDITDERDVSL